MFRRALAWLCSPKIGWEPSVLEMKKLWRAKNPSGGGGPVVLVPGRFPMISAEDERFVGYLEKHGALSSKPHLYLLRPFQADGRLVLYADRWKDAVDPLCIFLLQQCSEKLSTDLPVGLCARPECGRFFLPVRKTRKFCSNSCRARNHGTPESRREYMKRWYALQRLPGQRRRKMRKA
jgi:hypothetical protein